MFTFQQEIKEKIILQFVCTHHVEIERKKYLFYLTFDRYVIMNHKSVYAEKIQRHLLRIRRDVHTLRFERKLKQYS